MREQQPLQVVFDGHCTICQASMAHLLTMFGDQVVPVDFRSKSPGEIHPSLTEESCKAQMHVLADGRVYGGAGAIARVMRLHPVYRYIVWLYHVPPIGWLSEQVYRWISRNRFTLSKLFGKQVECTDACSIHDGQKKRAKQPKPKG